MQESMDSQFNSLNDQITESLKLRKRDKADHQQEFNKIINQIDDAIKITNTNQISLETLGQMVAAIIECFKIQQILDTSDENDKKSFGLQGLKENMKSDVSNKMDKKNKSFVDLEEKDKTSTLPDIKKDTGMKNSTMKKKKDSEINVQVDKKCLSCSGQSSTVLSAFKLACLNYNSSKVEYNTKVQDKLSVLDIRDQILKKIFEKLRTTEPWKNQKLQM